MTSFLKIATAALALGTAVIHSRAGLTGIPALLDLARRISLENHL